MLARTTSIVVILAVLVTLFSITSAIPILGDIQKRTDKAKPDIPGFIEDVRAASVDNLGLSLPALPALSPAPGSWFIVLH